LVKPKDKITHCLQELHFVWCIKCDQFETENIAEADMKPRQQSVASLMLLIHSILFDRCLFSSHLYIKTQLISTALQYEVYFALQKCDFAAHFATRYCLPKTLQTSRHDLCINYTIHCKL